jgi:hypothetical protein
MIIKNTRLEIILIIVIILLFIPFIAMQFTAEVSWRIADFVVMGVLLLSTGLLSELAIRKVSKIKHRIVLYIVILVVFLIVWAELAVGVFSTTISS